MKRLILLIIPIILLSISSIYAQENNCPCCTAEHRAFDFWIGEWEVTKPDGSPAGENTISKIEGDCLLREQWISATPGYTGTSYNFYNRQEKQWQQLWMDNQGAHLSLKGNIEAGSMVMMSEPTTTPNGLKVINRISWTPKPDGSVRQHWQVSQDGGKTWSTAFDGLYRKKA